MAVKQLYCFPHIGNYKESGRWSLLRVIKCKFDAVESLEATLLADIDLLMIICIHCTSVRREVPLAVASPCTEGRGISPIVI